ncbi:hypothetical protein BsWGS_15111 [Bradybaena similaris]
MKKAVVFLCFISCISLIVDAGNKQDLTKDDSWQFLLLAQFWPGTSCVFFREQGCNVPPGVNGWTIHGLWPSRNTSTQPEFCNRSMPFNYTEIKVLQNELDSYWPYYNKSGARTDLWQHEWEKHGTCAYVLPSIRGELKYFNATLQLYHNLNVYDTLSQAGIVPTQDKLYNLSVVFDAVLHAYKKIPQIECYYAEGKHYLDQVWLCYNRALQLQDCPEPSLTINRHFRRQSRYFQKLDSSLHFESEVQGPIQEDPVQTEKPPKYFVDCPKDGLVYYIPLP